ncbi:hypothetical protein [Enterococcus sp. AZ194]|uniref:hypothetical protein n=1 Tax=Enterococcus sp. AZ194 TaxID=2774629 RepID=UPI003F683211
MKDRESVMLPINETCTFQCFNYEAFLYNVLSNYEENNPVLFENYYGVQISKDWNNESYHLSTVLPSIDKLEALEVNKIQRGSLNRFGNNIIDIVIGMIEDGFYLSCYLNEFYLPKFSAFQEYFFWHDSLIFGFNRNKEVFLAYNYLEDGYLGKVEIRFQDFLYATDTLNKDIFKTDDFYFFKPKKNEREIDLEVLIKNFQDFIDGTPIDFKKRKKLCFGSETYSVIRQVYNEMEGKIDMRLPSKIHEHKKLLLDIVDYLLDKKIIGTTQLSEQVSNLTIKSEIIRRLSYRYNMSVEKNDINRNLLDKIVIKLDELVLSEKKILFMLTEELENYVFKSNS